MKVPVPLSICLSFLFALSAASAPSVVINEIAWGGSAADPKAEWIELFNGSGSEIDLGGWRLLSSDGAPNLVLSGRIAPGGYFLLIREGGTLPGIIPDLLYTGALTDRGETLYLYDPEGNLVDTANLPPDGIVAGWPGGTNVRGVPPSCSMERVDYRLPDRPDNWATCRSGEDGVCGTPKRENSAFNLPPAAAVTITPPYPSPGEKVIFDAGSSIDMNDPIVSYSWDFGDGTTAVGQTASHTYAGSGVYPVNLTVRDSKGGESTVTEPVAVSFPTPPLPDFSVIPPEGADRPRVGSPLSFRDESSGNGLDITGWEWNFGDGTTGTGKNVTHTYSTPGAYIVALTVTDERGTSSTQTDSLLIASLRPEARFTVDPATPTAGEPASFDPSGSNDPDGKVASYRWDFDGDGTIDAETKEASATYTYEESGTVHPTLYVIDDNGDISAPFEMEIRVNAPPVAGFRASTFSLNELEEGAFIDCSYDEDGTITDWKWDFGDGATSCQSSSVHAFRADGEYTVSLTVVDDAGAEGRAEAKVTVRNLHPVASLSVDCTPRQTGDQFTFDAGSSRDPSPEGRIVKYEWDIDDDGTFDFETASPTLHHAYDDDGEYRVRVRVTDDDGASATSDPVAVTVENRPAGVSRIDWTPSEPSDGEEISFTPTASDPDGKIIGWIWEFGDGETADSQTASHTFQNDGVYRLSLTVTDDDGASSTFSTEVRVKNSPPVAEFTETINGVRAAFDATGSYDPSPNGRIAHVAWDFGDGTTCPGVCDGTDRLNPVHVFPGPGSYTVTLVVIDDDGGIGRSTHQIRIRG